MDWRRLALRGAAGLQVTALAAMLASGLGAGQAQAAPAPAKAAAAKPAQPYGFEAIPAWVSEWPAAELQSPLVAAAPIQIVLSDDQVRLDPKNGEEHFRRRIRQIQEPSGLERGGQLEIEFDPGYQRLALHRLIVWRGGQKLDRLRSASIKLLQRETQLERQMVDGRLTASVVLEDIRVGDRVELAYTIRGANPVFGGRFVDQDWSLASRGPMALYRYRLLAPVGRDIRYRAGPDRYEISDQQVNGWRDLQLRRRNAPAFAWDPDQPAHELLPEQLSFSEYADWAGVGRWAEQLFAVARTGSEAPEIVAQAQALKRDTPAASIGAVLDFVQKEVRYFGTEIGANTHQPAPPATVLRQRFGDCKDKVALMAALLQAQGIASQPLLVSTTWRDAAVDQLPNPLAFDHAIIRVLPEGGQPLVLDPTRSQQTGPLSERQSLGLGRGLPAVADAAPIPTPTALGALRTDVTDTITFSQLDQDPTLEARWRYQGDHAEGVRAMLVGEGRAQFEKALRSDYARQYAGAEPQGEMQVDEVEGHNALQLSLRMRLPRYLRLVDDRQLVGDVGPLSLYPVLRLPDQAPRTRGLRLSSLGLYRHQVVVQYPEDVFASQASSPRREERDRFAVLRTQSQASLRRAEINAEIEMREEDVPAAEWAAHRDWLLKIWPRMNVSTSIGVLSPQAAEQLKGRFTQLTDDVRRGRVKVVTSVQGRSVAMLMAYDAALAGKRLPPTARAVLLKQRGIQLDNLGRVDEAKASFDEALQLAPEDAEVVSAAATNASQRRDDAGAIALVERGLKLQPGDVPMLMIRARSRYQLGELDAARDDVLQALPSARGQGVTYARLWLALITRRQGGDVAQALKAAPGTLEGADATAWPMPVLQAFNGERSDADARKVATSAAQEERLGHLCELNYFLGEWRWLFGQRDEARKLFQQSVDTGVVEFIEFDLARRRLAAGG